MTTKITLIAYAMYLSGIPLARGVVNESSDDVFISIRDILYYEGPYCHLKGEAVKAGLTFKSKTREVEVE